jgi:uncharacterized protein (DUF1697 family)
MIYIALFRGINVGGRAQVSMAGLRDVAASAGCTDARILMQSGNLVCRSGVRTSTALERRLEAEAKARLGPRPDVFVRSAAEWKEVVAANPFREEALRDPGHLLVMFLKMPVVPANVATLQSAITGREVVRARGRQAYIVYPDGIGRSRLTGALVEKTLGTRATGRNWNTVLKVAAVAAEI